MTVTTDTVFASSLTNGVKVEFEYNGKTRTGKVEKNTETLLTLELEGEDAKDTKFKSFKKSLIPNITIVG